MSVKPTRPPSSWVTQKDLFRVYLAKRRPLVYLIHREPSPPSSTAPSTPRTPADSSVVDSPPKKKARKAHKAKSTGILLKPGEELSTKSFIKVWEQEGKCAAYLGYTDLSGLRRFAMSPYVLQLVNIMVDEYRFRSHEALDCLRDHQDELRSEKDPLEAYPVEEGKTHSRRRIALCLAQMYRTIEKGRSSSDGLSQDDVAAAQSVFQRQKGLVPPTIDINAVILPKLGPFTDLGECQLEAYNRCIHALMGRFGSSNWDGKCVIDSSHIPTWMKPDLGEEPKEHAIDEPLGSTQREPASPRTPLSVEFWNQIWAMFSIERYGGQIHALRLILEKDEDDKRDFNLDNTSWDLVKTALWGETVLKRSFLLAVRRAEEALRKVKFLEKAKACYCENKEF
ncbi:hypothetical protein BDV95DRAFT_598392 [Massariosphaeria phaeospora]|uniref:Uncharacterized protein n=1 Tax=Massariosphaeria phaeospora TaxID=100035 RepID=A0A7C8M2P1_9PLEO|nr:hypothetical protein BDV95DRAFT_598392 [Massariosphaeria phaeospora]